MTEAKGTYHRSPMPELLSADQVAEALRELPAWTGGTDRLSRSVTVAADRRQELVDEVMRAADEMNHHPQVEGSGDAVTFVNWTHSAGGVTELDVRLAQKIDSIVARFA